MVIADSAPSIGLAFAAGLVSFLSPCVLPLVPVTSPPCAASRPASARVTRRAAARCWSRAGLFVLTFSAIFIVLGMSATGVGSTCPTTATLEKVAGIAIIAMGVFFLLALFIPLFNREWHVDALASARAAAGR